MRQVDKKILDREFRGFRCTYLSRDPVGVRLQESNRISNKILDRDWFSARLFDG